MPCVQSPTGPRVFCQIYNRSVKALSGWRLQSCSVSSSSHGSWLHCMLESSCWAPTAPECDPALLRHYFQHFFDMMHASAALSKSQAMLKGDMPSFPSMPAAEQQLWQLLSELANVMPREAWAQALPATCQRARQTGSQLINVCF